MNEHVKHAELAEFRALCEVDADALIEADLSGADLNWANLCGANLCGANLASANLHKANLCRTDLSEVEDVIDAGRDSRGFRFTGWRTGDSVMILAGCRSLTLREARDHWRDRHDGALRAQCNAKLDYIETIALARGWMK